MRHQDTRSAILPNKALSRRLGGNVSEEDGKGLAAGRALLLFFFVMGGRDTSWGVPDTHLRTYRMDTHMQVVLSGGMVSGCGAIGGDPGLAGGEDADAKSRPLIFSSLVPSLPSRQALPLCSAKVLLEAWPLRRRGRGRIRRLKYVVLVVPPGDAQDRKAVAELPGSFWHRAGACQDKQDGQPSFEAWPRFPPRSRKGMAPTHPPSHMQAKGTGPNRKQEWGRKARGKGRKMLREALPALQQAFCRYG